jgi:hypothetical protein
MRSRVFQSLGPNYRRIVAARSGEDLNRHAEVGVRLTVARSQQGLPAKLVIKIGQFWKNSATFWKNSACFLPFSCCDILMKAIKALSIKSLKRFQQCQLHCWNDFSGVNDLLIWLQRYQWHCWNHYNNEVKASRDVNSKKCCAEFQWCQWHYYDFCGVNETTEIPVDFSIINDTAEAYMTPL